LSVKVFLSRLRIAFSQFELINLYKFERKKLILLDLSGISNIIDANTPQEIWARNLWFRTFYHLYIENIWNNADVWRFISMFSILLLIFYKKRIRFLNTKEEKIAQDKSIFVNSDLIVSEDFFKEFLIELSINESFSKSKYERIKDFCAYFELRENKYIISSLKDSAQNLCKYLDDLIKFLDDNFEETHVKGLFKLSPKLKESTDFVYTDFQEELYKLCRHAESLYGDYRLNVKAKLSL
jgi:hypothetical protein